MYCDRNNIGNQSYFNELCQKELNKIVGGKLNLSSTQKKLGVIGTVIGGAVVIV